MPVLNLATLDWLRVTVIFAVTVLAIGYLYLAFRQSRIISSISKLQDVARDMVTALAVKDTAIENLTQRIVVYQAELEFRESMLRSVFDMAPDAIIIMDADERIVKANPSAHKVFGYSQGSLTNRKVPELMHEKYREMHWAGVRHFLETGEAKMIGRPLLLEAMNSDGEEFPIELTLAAWRVNNHQYFSAIIRSRKRRSTDA